MRNYSLWYNHRLFTHCKNVLLKYFSWNFDFIRFYHLQHQRRFYFWTLYHKIHMFLDTSLSYSCDIDLNSHKIRSPSIPCSWLRSPYPHMLIEKHKKIQQIEGADNFIFVRTAVWTVSDGYLTQKKINLNLFS